MTTFTYAALENKKEVRGEIDAPNEREAVQTLRGQGLFVIKMQSGGQQSIPEFRQYAQLLLPTNWLPAKKQAYIQLYRQLSLMLMSGHTLLESLELSANLAPRRRMAKTLQSIRTDIQRGNSFAQALEKYPKTFQPQVVELVRSAEASGELDKVLLRLAEDLERILEMRRQLITALIYPAIVVFMTIGLLIMMATWVLPKMKNFIEGRGSNIPTSTANMIALSDFIVSRGTTLAIGFCVIVFLLFASYTTLPGKRFFDRLFLSIPLISSSIISSAMAQAGWTLSMLTASGVTIMDSLKICARITNNETLKTSFHHAEKQVLEGTSLAVALQQPAVPDLFHKMAAVGEKSGELDRVMSEIGNYYNIELQANLKRVLAVIEPTLLLMVGIPVAFVYLSIFQLIFAVSTGGK
jgi:type II secretory pathway component PulF